MKPKLLGLIFFLICLSTISLIRSYSKVQIGRTSPPFENRLRWYAEIAKQEGKERVTIPTMMFDYAGSANAIDIDQALATYTVVVAQPVEKRTYEFTSNDLITWHKFRIIESLSEQKSPACPSCNTASAPAEFLPLKPDEFLVPKNGGQLVIDGVEIWQVERDFPQYEEGKKYLLLLSMYTSGVATTAGGPLGVFLVNGDSSLSPINHRRHRLKDGLKEKFSDSKDRLREHLKLSH